MFEVDGSASPDGVHEDALDDRLLAAADAAHAALGAAQTELLRQIARLDRAEVWRGWGARDTAHLLGLRYGISAWKAHRWIAAAHALEGLPHLAHALEGGELGIDKVCELARFATPQTELRLIGWAKTVSVGAVRHRAAWLPGSRAFLGRMRTTGRRLVLVTNAHPEILAIKDAQLGVRRCFDAVHSSFGFGEPKESPAFWPRLAELEGFDPRRTLFADDSLAVLRAARGHGIAWLYAIRRPVGSAPVRDTADFPAVDAVHELATGLVPVAA